MVLVVDLAGVGQDMLAVPIKAECLVPKVRVNPVDLLEYGTVFLRHKKTMSIEIVNEDDLKSKFEILPQEEPSKRMAIFDVDTWSGVIEPR
jgi:hydrocephalus-inducing protein